MKIDEEERKAILTVLELAGKYGYGNLISHLNTRWARLLMRDYNWTEKEAREFVGSDRTYHFKMQDDILERGEWDTTGESYI